MDGWIILGTKIDTKQLENDIKDAEKRLEQFEKEAKSLTTQKAKLEIDTSKSEKNIEILNNKIELTLKKMQNEEHKLSIIPSNAGEEYQKQLLKVEQIKTSYQNLTIQHEELLETTNRQEKKLSDINTKIQENTKNQGLLNNEIEEMNEKLDKAKGINNIKDGINDASNSMSNLLTKIAKWGLALFSIRSIYNMISSSVGILTGYNEQLNTDIEYIRYAIATALQPVIEYIVQLVYKMLIYINHIASAWFGVNLFANATTEAFEKQNKALGTSVKQVRELKKQLLGFDEMNVLQEDGSVQAGGGGGGIGNILPSTDLSSLQDVEIPGWIDLIARNGDFLKELIYDIGKAFLTWKVLELVNHLKLFGEGISNIQRLLQGAGIALIIIGIWNAIDDVINLIANPSWENFYKLLGDLSLALTGLSLVLIGINSSNPFGWVTLAISGIGILVSAFGGLFSSTEEETDALKRQEDATKRLKDAQDNLYSVTGEYTNAVKTAERAHNELEQAEKDTGISGENLYRKVEYGIISYKNLTEEQRKVFDAYVAELEAQENLEKQSEKYRLAKSYEKQAITENNVALIEQGKHYDETFETLIQASRDGDIRMHEFSQRTLDIFKNLSDEGKETFAKQLPEDIREALISYGEFDKVTFSTKDGTIKSFGEILRAAQFNFSGVKDSILKTLDYDNFKNQASKITSMFDSIRSKMQSIAGTWNVDVSTNGSSNYKNAKGGIITKLATGAIVSQPGRGVPVANSIYGEAGKEGILPLTDSQAMSMLAQEIGKWINLNATIPIYIGNRMIAREIREINAQSDFAYNR